MSPSNYVGRVGGLAAALGIGVAVFTAPAVAWADPDAPVGSSDSASASDAAPSRADSPRVRRSDSGSRPRAGRTAGTPSLKPSDSLPEVTIPRRSHRTSDPAPSPAAAVRVSNASPASSAPTPAPAAAVVVAPAASVAAPAASLPTNITLPPAVRSKITSLLQPKPIVLPVKPTPVTTLATVADRLTATIQSAMARIVESLANGSPFVPAAESPANWLLAAFTRKQPLSAATGLVQSNTEVQPTVLLLNGYKVAATSIETVRAFNGQWTYWPGVSSVTQGIQDFELVDPNTQQSVGSFTALIQQGDPTSLGTKYVELLVTANDGRNVGTDAGQIPPVGSIISSWTVAGLVGWRYSSMPTESGENKVSLYTVTPFGDIRNPFFWYDAAKGVADHTFDNKPIDVTNGFSIVPTNPDGETITATSGLIPLFNSIQGKQNFSVVDSTGTATGHFYGDYTTTGDVLGITTEAIRVIANDGVNVGTEPGQAPPVGTVYNVAYLAGGRVWLLYSAFPQDSGEDVLKFQLGLPFGVINFKPRLNAVREPAITLVAPGSKEFVATSEQLPAGINGLPPRDVQIQGYQQFDVFDTKGVKLGSVDADVTSLWDNYGIQSKSLLITKVNEGTPGADATNVPTVGTVVNFIYFAGGKFGISDSVTPLPTGEVRAFQFITPFGVIPLPPSTVPVGRIPVEYYDPFAIV